MSEKSELLLLTTVKAERSTYRVFYRRDDSQIIGDKSPVGGAPEQFGDEIAGRSLQDVVANHGLKMAEIMTDIHIQEKPLFETVHSPVWLNIQAKINEALANISLA